MAAPLRELFPGVIELNVQARRRLGCCVYVVHDGMTDGGGTADAASGGDDGEFVLIDIGYEDIVDDLIALLRQIDFPLARCKALVATHADADHIQGLAKAKELLPSAEVLCHPAAKTLIEEGDRQQTFAEIAAQDIDLPMPPVPIDRTIDEGDTLAVGRRELTVWHTPGHAPAQLSFYLPPREGDDQTPPILLSGDNIYRDGCVGHIDPHHGSDIPDFIASLERILASDADWLLPSHGPAFRKDPTVLKATIARLKDYARRADFGTCAVEWPLLDEWDDELARGVVPMDAAKSN